MYTKLLALLLICTLIKQNKATRRTEAFSCVGKVIGGYYTDVQSGCQMFHVCTLDGKGELQDIVFRCIDGTVFEQETRVCEREEEVNCETSEDFFYLNNELYGPGIIPDTANDNSFKTGQVKTLNGSITRPIDLQSNLTRSNSDFVRISRPTSSWSTKISTDKKISSFSCNSKQGSGFFADEEVGCHVFHLCIELKSGRLKLKESHACSKNGAWYDQRVGKCVTTLPSNCGETNVKGIPPTFIKGLPKNSIMDLCKSVGFKGLLPNLDSDCRQYISCNIVDGVVVAKTHICKFGFSFSSKYKLCIRNYKNKCRLDSTDGHPKELFGIKSKKKYQNLRYRRSSQFENHNNHRESSSRSLTRSSAIFSDHASVIDNPSPGNIVMEGSNMPNKEKKDKLVATYSKAFTPQTSHARNQTIRNGTLVEISEISSPDQGGKVTITSIVPKFVRLNGNNQRSDSESSFITPGISVSSIQSQVTFSGANAITGDRNIATEKDDKLADLANTFGNETLSDNETALESDTLSTNNLYLDSSTVAITTLEPTKLMEESTINPVNIETTASAISKSTPDMISPTKLDQSEIIETNFTCKDKELEHFYPDVEAECRVFHYCAPGFSVDQVLDLKFLCTGNTRFDSTTSKCQNKSEVSCETPTVFHGITTTTPLPTTSSPKVTTLQTTSTTSTPTQVITTGSTTLSTQKSEIPSSSSTTQQSTRVSSTSTQESTTISASTQESTTVSTSTQKSTTVSTPTPTQTSSTVASKLSTPEIVTSEDSSINLEFTANNSAIDFTEEISLSPVAESSTPSSTDNSAKLSEIDITSLVGIPETSELFSTSTSTITPTLKITTEDINTQSTKEDYTAEIAQQILMASPLNTEKTLLSKEKSPENMTIPDQSQYDVSSEKILTENLTEISNLFVNEENVTRQLDLDDTNTTVDIIMEWNISSNDSMDESSLQNLTTVEENNATDSSIISVVETSTHYEYKNETSSLFTEDYTNTSLIDSTVIESDIVTEGTLPVENLTSIPIPI